jgi:hypothetical protein
MLSGWRRPNGAHRINQTCFQSRMLLEVEPFSLSAIRIVDRSEIGFLSHCYLPFFRDRSQTGRRLSSFRGGLPKRISPELYLSSSGCTHRYGLIMRSWGDVACSETPPKTTAQKPNNGAAESLQKQMFRIHRFSEHSGAQQYSEESNLVGFPGSAIRRVVLTASAN